MALGSMMATLGQLRETAGMPRYRRYFSVGQTVFLTIVCEGRRRALLDAGAKHAVLEALRDSRAHHPFRHHGHVLLNDHLHLLLSPATQVSVPKLVSSFKQAVLARLPVEGRLWQRRYYDHIIRGADDFSRYLDYIHFNPVKHGLVANVASWPWSSFAAWREKGAYAPDWGSIEPAHIRDMRE